MTRAGAVGTTGATGRGAAAGMTTGAVTPGTTGITGAFTPATERAVMASGFTVGTATAGAAPRETEVAGGVAPGFQFIPVTTPQKKVRTAAATTAKINRNKRLLVKVN